VHSHPLRRLTAFDARGVALYLLPAALACAVWFGADLAHGSLGKPLTFVLMAAAFAVAERAQLLIEVRKQTHVIAATDIPFAIGLLVLPPLGMLVTGLAAKAVRARLDRQSPGKAVFNLGLQGLTVGLAVTISHAVSIADGITDPVTWLAVVVGTVVADLISSMLVAFAIGVAERQLSRRRLLSAIVPAASLAVVGTALGLVGMLVISVSSWGGALLVVVLAVALYGHRAYGRFLAQHERLGQVYAFSQLVEAAKPEPAAFGELLEFIRETLNAGRITLLLWPAEDSNEGAAGPTTLRVDADGNADWSAGAIRRDPLRDAVRTDGRGRLVTNRHGTLDGPDWAALADRKANEVMVVPLRTSDRLLGIVEVCDRQAKLNAFSAEELRLLDNLASHLAAAVENQRLVERLRMQAFQDQLTELPNRIQFTADIAQVLEGADSDAAYGVAVFGVDSVVAVNDTLGHDAGDQLMIAVADRLRRLPDSAVSVARVGGNVFALLLRGPDIPAVQALVRAWHERLYPPCQVGDLTIELALSGGLAIWPAHASDAAVLLQRANVALQAARNTGESIVTFAAAMEHGSLRRLQLVTDLRSALAAGQLAVHYQPKVSLTGDHIDGVEALLRWEHPAYGNVPPDDFVPLAEQTGLIGPVTTFVLDSALRQSRSWLDRGERIGVAVNLSVRSLLDPELVGQVSGALARSGVPAELLTLEITEGTVMAEPGRSIPVLHHLHELGVRLAIDDFGTGYSSLSYLRRLPVDTVKIDKGFVIGMGSDAGDLAIVRAIVELCHSLRFQVVAEGVEDELSRDLLRGMGCDTAQGYLISRPLPADRLDAWLAAWLAAHAPDGRVRRLHVSGG